MVANPGPDHGPVGGDALAMLAVDLSGAHRAEDPVFAEYPQGAVLLPPDLFRRSVASDVRRDNPLSLGACPNRGLTLAGEAVKPMKLTRRQSVRPLFG
jgi:hypothetical protein